MVTRQDPPRAERNGLNHETINPVRSLTTLRQKVNIVLADQDVHITAGLLQTTRGQVSSGNCDMISSSSLFQISVGRLKILCSRGVSLFGSTMV